MKTRASYIILPGGKVIRPQKGKILEVTVKEVKREATGGD